MANKLITDMSKLTKACDKIILADDKQVSTDAAKEVIAELKGWMEKHPEAKAISAPQLGINARAFCIRFSDQIKSFINPIVTKKSGVSVTLETLESMPGKEIVVHRPNELHAVYIGDDCKYAENKFVGAAAAIFDQQSLLLDGVIPEDLGLVFDVEKDGHITDEDLAELVPYLNNFVSAKLSSMSTEIEKDADTKKKYKEMKFEESVINGKTAVVDDPTMNMNREQRRAYSRACKSAQKKRGKRR